MFYPVAAGKQEIVKDGLVLWLDANDKTSYPGAGTTWRDLTPGDNNGTLTNGPTFDSGNGGSIVFDGVDDYVDGIQEVTFPIGSQDQTIETVAYLGSKSIHGIFSYGDNTAGGRIELGCRDTWIVVALGFGAYGVNDSNNFGKWVHITAIPGTTTADLTLYINGESKAVSKQAGTSYTKNTTSTGRYFVGTIPDTSGGPFSGYTLNGSVAYVRLYNRALTAEEILQNYNATKDRFGL